MSHAVARIVAIGVATIGCAAPVGAQTTEGPERGKLAFEACAACHTLRADEESENPGPTLEGVLGRTAASRDDFRYSAALRRSGIVWTLETIEAFIADPKRYIRGNRMSYGGIPDAAERAELMAYLKRALEQP